MKKIKFPKIVKKLKGKVFGNGVILLNTPNTVTEDELHNIKVFIAKLSLPNMVVVLPKDVSFDEYQLEDLEALRDVIEKGITFLKDKKSSQC